MKSSARRRWTRGEKWLFGAPLLVGAFAIAMQFGPELVRKKMGLPREIKITPNGLIYNVKVSHNGQSLVVASWDRTRSTSTSRIEVWDARTLQKWDVPSHCLAAPASPTSGGFYSLDSLAVSPDAKHIAFSSGGVIPFGLYNLTTGKRNWQVPYLTGFSGKTSFRPDGQQIVVMQNNKTATRYVSRFLVLQTATGRVVSQWQWSKASADLLNFTPENVAFSQDGMVAYVDDAGFLTMNAVPQVTGHIEVRRAKDGVWLRRLTVPNPDNIALSPDGKNLLVLSYSGTVDGVVCLNFRTGRELWSCGKAKDTASFFITDAAWSSDAAKVALYEASSQSVLILNASSGTIERILPFRSQATKGLYTDGLAFSSDGQRLFARGKDAVLVWDLD